MLIRSATEADHAAIIALLKESLGESLMPKSERFWQWKHVENPFGKSPVLLAFENDQLIGVRAFMKWEWRQGEKIFKAVRAVDTATHPAFQGKGIFSKLTAQLVNECKEEGVDFIFNTPNKKSMPGYLKLGWRSLGKLNISVSVRLRTQPNNQDKFLIKHGVTPSAFVELEKFNFNHLTADKLRTNWSTTYFKWRYLNNPNIQYGYFKNDDDGLKYLAFFRLKNSKLGTEFRICDVMIMDKAHEAAFKMQLKKMVKESGARMITIAGDTYHSVAFFKWPIGPYVTIRPISLQASTILFENWSPTLGDLEVF